jgi:uncharacterized protein YndB with AHSA1/START domain
MALLLASPTTLSVHIEAPVEEVFAFWADPTNWTRFGSPGMQDVDLKEVNVTPEGVGTTHHWAMKIAGIPYEVKGRFTEFVKDRRIVDVYEGHLMGKFVYRFKPEGSGMQLTMEHDPGPIAAVPVLGVYWEDQELKTHLKALELLKAHLEA